MSCRLCDETGESMRTHRPQLDNQDEVDGLTEPAGTSLGVRPATALGACGAETG